MKNFPFKTLFLCLFLPPIFYMLTLNVLERYLQKQEFNALKGLIVQDLGALYEGRYSVKEEVNRNVGEHLRQGLRFRLGLAVNILVKTVDDRILYPAQPVRGQWEGEGFSELPQDSLRYMEVASENFKTLSDGLILSVKAQIRHNSWISNTILVSYVLLAVFVIKLSVRRGIRAAQKQEEENKTLFQKLAEQLRLTEERLQVTEGKEAEYMEKMDAIRREKADLSVDVDALLEEIEKQEAGLNEQKQLRQALEIHVEQLRTELHRLSEKPKKKRKTTEADRKRFSVLYKNLAFTDRALEGFSELTEEFQLKAEQVIQKLNENESSVAIKRKVFGKGGKLNVLEVVFSYSGRIYYQKDSQAKKTIVAIGNKNTQEKDLAYLEGIAS